MPLPALAKLRLHWCDSVLYRRRLKPSIRPAGPSTASSRKLPRGRPKPCGRSSCHRIPPTSWSPSTDERGASRASAKLPTRGSRDRVDQAQCVLLRALAWTASKAPARRANLRVEANCAVRGMSRNRQTDNSVLQLLDVLRVGGASPAGTRCDRRSRQPAIPAGCLPSCRMPSGCQGRCGSGRSPVPRAVRDSNPGTDDTCRALVHPRRSRAGAVSNAAETTANPASHAVRARSPLLSSLGTTKLTAAALRDIGLIVGGRRRPGRDLAGDRTCPSGAPNGTDAPICNPSFRGLRPRRPGDTKLSGHILSPKTRLALRGGRPRVRHYHRPPAGGVNASPSFRSTTITGDGR